MSHFESSFHYCLPLADAMQTLFGWGRKGRKWENSAGLFQHPKYVRDALLSAAKRIRGDLRRIATADARFLLITFLTLDGIEREAKRLDHDSNNQLELIAYLLKLIAQLLGYDWDRGEPNRHLMYYQTVEQQDIDDKRLSTAKFTSDITQTESYRECQRVGEIVSMLHEEGFREGQISRMMGVSLPIVRDILVRAGRIERRQ